MNQYTRASFCTAHVLRASPTIDPVAAARWHAAAPAASPWLHEEVARRMEDRLQWIRQAPESWCHWDPVRGGLQAHALVSARYPQARCQVYETSAHCEPVARQALAKPWWNPARWGAGALQMGPPADASVQMLWSNMALHMAADPQDLIGRWHRALAVDGYLMFSCLGPDTLRELHGVYAALGWPPAGHAFTDMHDWGDMLVHAGFAEPVMDMERITLTFATPSGWFRSCASWVSICTLIAFPHCADGAGATSSTKCCLSVWPIRARMVSWH